MDKNHISLIIFLLIGSLAISQTDKEKAINLGQKAIKLMDEGQLDKSIKLLKKAENLDPDRIDYPYEIAYAYYKKKNYKKTIKILHTITDHKDVSDYIYQLLGNSYDYIDKPEKALETYNIGMKKFPDSGKFYLEAGQIKFSHKKYDEAMDLWEKGIKVDPNYSSNYYRLAKLFSYTKERIWTLIYGEYFMLLEPNTKRTEEISKLLFENYKKSREMTSDSTVVFHLTEKGHNINLADEKSKKGILPFGGTFALSLVATTGWFKEQLDIKALYQVRKDFLNYWFIEKKFNQIYPNKLFSIQKEIQEATFFEAYTYWLLSEGSLTEYQNWYSENEQKFSDFVNWFNREKIDIRKKDFNSRKDYK
ncbi:tetratricopeptide repeat protein [Mesonia aquimarina]|uniref:tetratricopeptide repeat protein n=1 Tax=Mesonia aquimarina TaxID=1504967 RepID=UPI000EF61841|nr:tetratricopeptide repeat protein [Mesonia aquimarina]